NHGWQLPPRCLQAQRSRTDNAELYGVGILPWTWSGESRSGTEFCRCLQGLDARELLPRQRREKCFLLTSPFIEPTVWVCQRKAGPAPQLPFRGVTPLTRRRRRRAFDPPGYRTVTLRKPESPKTGDPRCGLGDFHACIVESATV